MSKTTYIPVNKVKLAMNRIFAENKSDRAAFVDVYQPGAVYRMELGAGEIKRIPSHVGINKYVHSDSVIVAEG